MTDNTLNLEGGRAPLPSKPAASASILVGVCGGKTPRVGVTIPAVLFAAVPLASRDRATVTIQADGKMCVRFGAGRKVTIRPDQDGYVQVPAAEVPGVTTARISRKRFPAITIGGDVVTMRPLAEGFFATGRPPVVPASLPELRAMLDRLNDQIAARRAGGTPVEIHVADGRISLETFDRVKL